MKKGFGRLSVLFRNVHLVRLDGKRTNRPYAAQIASLIAAGLLLSMPATADEGSPLQRQARHIDAARALGDHPFQIVRVGRSAQQLGIILAWNQNCASARPLGVRAWLDATTRSIADEIAALPEPSRQFAAGVAIGSRAAFEALGPRICEQLTPLFIDSLILMDRIDEHEGGAADR